MYRLVTFDTILYRIILEVLEILNGIFWKFWIFFIECFQKSWKISGILLTVLQNSFENSSYFFNFPEFFQRNIQTFFLFLQKMVLNAYFDCFVIQISKIWDNSVKNYFGSFGNSQGNFLKVLNILYRMISKVLKCLWCSFYNFPEFFHKMFKNSSCFFKKCYV